jgi:hypothetical protein
MRRYQGKGRVIKIRLPDLSSVRLEYHSYIRLDVLMVEFM